MDRSTLISRYDTETDHRLSDDIPVRSLCYCGWFPVGQCPSCDARLTYMDAMRSRCLGCGQPEPNGTSRIKHRDNCVIHQMRGDLSRTFAFYFNDKIIAPKLIQLHHDSQNSGLMWSVHSVSENVETLESINLQTFNNAWQCAARVDFQRDRIEYHVNFMVGTDKFYIAGWKNLCNGLSEIVEEVNRHINYYQNANMSRFQTWSRIV